MDTTEQENSKKASTFNSNCLLIDNNMRRTNKSESNGFEKKILSSTGSASLNGTNRVLKESTSTKKKTSKKEKVEAVEFASRRYSKVAGIDLAKVSFTFDPEKPPKRPLSAYNLFFHLERQRILEGEADRKFSMNDVAKFAEDQRLNAHKPKSKRKHRKSHGKISFTALARTIAANWKAMGEDQKAIFNGYFNVELSRYKKELEMWNAKKENLVREGNDYKSLDVDNNVKRSLVSSESDSLIDSSEHSYESVMPSKQAPFETHSPHSVTSCITMPSQQVRQLEMPPVQQNFAVQQQNRMAYMKRMAMMRHRDVYGQGIQVDNTPEALYAYEPQVRRIGFLSQCPVQAMYEETEMLPLEDMKDCMPGAYIIADQGYDFGCDTLDTDEADEYPGIILGSEGFYNAQLQCDQNVVELQNQSLFMMSKRTNMQQEAQPFLYEASYEDMQTMCPTYDQQYYYGDEISDSDDDYAVTRQTRETFTGDFTLSRIVRDNDLGNPAESPKIAPLQNQMCMDETHLHMYSPILADDYEEVVNGYEVPCMRTLFDKF